jgi:hypothetical protein
VRWTIPQEDAEAVGSMGSMAEGAGPGMPGVSNVKTETMWFSNYDKKKLVVGKKLENFELMLVCSSGSSILGMPTRILFSSTTKQKMSFRNILLVMRCWQRQRDNSSFQAWQVDFRLRKHQQF